MGVSDHGLSAEWFRSLSKRIRKIPTGLSRLSHRGAEFRGKLKTLGFLIASLALGILGARFSQDQALLRWKRENAPPSRVWKASLEAYSFRRLKKLSMAHRVLRTLPVQYDPAGGFWTASDSRWIVVSIPGSTEPLIFTVFEDSELKKNPSLYPSSSEWKPGEAGWPGLQGLLARLEALPVQTPKPISNSVRKKPAPWRDPMEITF